MIVAIPVLFAAMAIGTWQNGAHLGALYIVALGIASTAVYLYRRGKSR